MNILHPLRPTHTDSTITEITPSPLHIHPPPCRWVYPEDTPLRQRPPEAPADALSPWVMALIVVGLTAAAVAIFIGGA
jgi:hypothetical protein